MLNGTTKAVYNASLLLFISSYYKQSDLTLSSFEPFKGENTLRFAQLLGRFSVLNHVSSVLAASFCRQNSQLMFAKLASASQIPA